MKTATENIKRVLGYLAVFCLFFSGIASAEAPKGSLRVNYAEVMVENFQPGITYNMTQVVNMPFEVTNRYDIPVIVQIGITPPEIKRVKKGFEPIPDTRWVNLGKSEVVIQPHETYKTDVRVTIPDKSEYLGKRYEVNFLTQLTGTPNGQAPMMTLALQGRLLFSVVPVKQKTDLSQTRTDLDFKVIPDWVKLDQFPLGRKIEIFVSGDKPVLLENPGEKPKTIGLTSIDPKATVMVQPGYDPTEHPEFLTFAEKEFTLPGHAQKPLHLFLELPDQPEYKDKLMYFIVNISTGGAAVQAERYLRILVSTFAEKM